MILGFVHDHVLVKIGNSMYSAGGLPCSIWDRYLKTFREVHVLTRFKEKDDHIDISKLSISNHENVFFSPSNFYRGFLDSFFHRKKIKEEIKKFVDKCDVINIRLPSVLGMMTFSVAKALKKPIGVEVVSSTWDVYWNYGIKGKILAPFMHKKVRYIIKNADAVAYITDKYLQSEYPTKTMHFNNVANVSLRDDYFSDGSIFYNKDYDNNIIIGLIGPYATRYKGQEMAIRAIKILNKDKKREFYLELVGSGDPTHLIEYAERLGVKKYIRTVGAVSHNEIPAWIDSLNIYIQPSKAEGHGRTVIEAMGRGCPVVSTNVGGLKESVQPELRVKYNDEEDLARKILMLCNDKELRDTTIGENIQHAMLFQQTTIENKRQDFLKYLKSCKRY